jgi:GxxExxY protein
MDVSERDPLTEKIIGCCYLVHTQLGPGFKEFIYQRSLLIAFRDTGLKIQQQREFKVRFNSIVVGIFFADFFIEDKVILEIKSVTGIMPAVFRQQVLSYLRASKTKTGLLVNFGNKSCEVKRYSC